MSLAVIVDLDIDMHHPELATAEIAGRPALAWTLLRARSIPGVSDVVLSLAAEAATADVCAIGAWADAAVHVAQPCDPLARLARAVEIAECDVVVRLRARQPLIDADIAARALGLYAEAKADFACTDMPALWPAGLEVEVFSADLAFTADRKAHLPYERANPTRWMRREAGLKRACLLGPGCGFEDMRFGLEGPQDLVALRALAAEMGEAAFTATAAEIAALLMRRQDLLDLNRAASPDPLRILVRETAEVQSAPQALLAA
jgi:spore coat polysaccharide biosynthesis protein SpsF (cytidylyltransferase family)